MNEAVYIIAGPKDPYDDEQLYWGNREGWVPKDEASRFLESETEHPDFHLPMGATHLVRVEEGAAT